MDKYCFFFISVLVRNTPARPFFGPWYEAVLRTVFLLFYFLFFLFFLCGFLVTVWLGPIVVQRLLNYRGCYNVQYCCDALSLPKNTSDFYVFLEILRQMSGRAGDTS